MDATLKKIRNVNGGTCVTITLNTHRTHPENEQDAIQLKNLIKEAQERLLAEHSKREMSPVLENLAKLEARIDHQHNKESLVLFANEKLAEFTRLTVTVTDKVIIDDAFATRDLIRAQHLQTHYYILLLSQQKARLIHAANDKLVEEVGKPFPIENNQFYSTNGPELSNASRQTNLINEFFNRIDKQLNQQRKEENLPVLICSEESSFHEYMKIADQPDQIFDFYLNKNRLDDNAQAVVRDAWGLVHEFTVNTISERKEELLQAVGRGKHLSDVNDIWNALPEGRIKSLYVEETAHQPAIVSNNYIRMVDPSESSSRKVVDDVYDRMIEQNLAFGGDVIFLPEGELSEFNGMGAVVRY